MSPESSPQPLSASIALGLSASRYAPIVPVAPRPPRRPTDPKANRAAALLAPASEIQGDSASEAPYQRALILASARRRHASIGNELARGLRERGVYCDLHLTGRGRASASARLAVSPPDQDLVIAVGDVRRLTEVYAALPNASMAVACLPQGGRHSTERFVRAHALPRDIDGLLEVIFSERPSALPTARVGTELALFRTAFGFEALGSFRRAPRFSAMLDACRHTFAIELDGRRLPGAYVNVAAVPTLDRLRVELWPARGALGGLATGLARAVLGRPPRVLSARRVCVFLDRESAARPIPGHVDGMPVCSPGLQIADRELASATITLGDDAYRLLHPAR